MLFGRILANSQTEILEKLYLPIGKKLANSQIAKHLYALWQNIREFANRDPSKNYNLPIGIKLANSQIAKKL